MLSAVRTRVLEQTGKARASWFERLFYGALRQRATVAGLALLVLGGSAFWIWRGTESQPVDATIPAAPRVTPVLPDPNPMPEPATRVVEAKPVRHRRASAADRKPDVAKETTIKLLTDDPNVIIYWLVEEKGD
jgi:hypothetical protein